MVSMQRRQVIVQKPGVGQYQEVQEREAEEVVKGSRNEVKTKRVAKQWATRTSVKVKKACSAMNQL